MGEAGQGSFSDGFGDFLSARFKETGAAGGDRGLNPNRNAGVGWIGPNKAFPIRTGELAKPLILKV